MLQILLKVFITLGTFIALGFFLHTIWTHDIDIVRFFRKLSDVIPIKEQGEAEPASRAIQEVILEENKRQTEEAKKQTHLLEQMQRTEQADHDEFTREYGLGYALFAVKDGREIITLDTKRLEHRLHVNWADAKIAKLTDESITIQLSNLFDRKYGNSIRMPFGLSISRKADNIPGPRLIIGGVEVTTKLLYDDGKDIICLIGFREIGK